MRQPSLFNKLPRNEVLSKDDMDNSCFKYIEISDWRQFDAVSLDLSNRVTVLTGANGTGKSTLLNILAEHFGWSLSFVSTPRIRGRSADRIRSDIREQVLFDDKKSKGRVVPIGAIGYQNGETCRLLVEETSAPTYSLKYSGLQKVQGVFIPSHRPQAVHTPVKEIPTNPVAAQQQYQEYQRLLMRMSEAGSARNPGTVQKQSIIALAVFGEGNRSVAPNEQYLLTLKRLEHALTIMLPPQFEFEALEVRDGDVVLCTAKGDFSIDAMSGGVSSIFGLAWQLTMFGAHEIAFTIVIDEPENHLHPSMQRMLLPNIAEAFPDCRIVVATHSPFIITSFPEANVYGLDYNDKGRIETQKLSTSELSGTPNKVLREILDVDSNLPAWVEEKVRSVLNDPSLDNDPKARAEKVMSELSRLGLSNSLAEFRS